METKSTLNKLSASSFLVLASALCLSLGAGAQTAEVAEPTNTDSTAAPSCVSNRSGALVNELAGNESLNSAIASIGGVRGLLATWSYEDKGNVRFYQSSAGRLMLSYDYGFFGSGSARINKVCKISSSTLKLTGTSDGEPFSMYVKGVGKARSVELGTDNNGFRRFYK